MKKQQNIFVLSDRAREWWVVTGTVSVDFPDQMGSIDATVLLKQNT